jgi:small conductance mechanosensitive channel
VNELPVGMIEFSVRPWCDSAHFWDVYFYMKENIKKAFDKEGIHFPTPGMNINLKQ